MSKSEATAAFQNMVLVIHFLLSIVFELWFDIAMQFLILRPFRKDNIYFRTIKEREKIYWVPLPTQLYFLISSFKYVHTCNWKTFVCEYHLNDPTTFLHHQIQVCSAHARILALGYKNAFSVLPVHGLVIFHHRAQFKISKDLRWVYENWNV